MAMYRSLEKQCVGFHIYIFAFDDKSYEILHQLKLEKATIVSLFDFEDEKLLSVKPLRSKAEYCWTCTSSAILYVIEKYKVSACTYLDADLYFYQDPKIVFDEMGSNSILITEHRYPPKFNRTTKSGIYCVQFIAFLNDERGMIALRWWRNACIEWCYDRYEDGKFGDQKYLDDWPTRFKGVHVLQHLGGGLASWNVEQYPFVERMDDRIIFFDKVKNVKFQAVFYHFHHVRFYLGNMVDFGWRHPTMPVVNNVYVPYLFQLAESEKQIKLIDPDFNIPLKKFTLIHTGGLKNNIKYLIKIIFRYNVFNTQTLIRRNK
jgi:hypothetical protein